LADESQSESTEALPFGEPNGGVAINEETTNQTVGTPCAPIADLIAEDLKSLNGDPPQTLLSCRSPEFGGLRRKCRLEGP